MPAYGLVYVLVVANVPVLDRLNSLDLRSRWATRLVVQSLRCCSRSVSFYDRRAG